MVAPPIDSPAATDASATDRSPGSEPVRGISLGIVLSLLWVAAYCSLYFSVSLSNNPEFSRFALLTESPWLLLDLFSASRPTDSLASGWNQLPQRFPIWAISAAMAVVAISSGQGVLRLVGMGRRLHRWDRWVFAYAIGVALLATSTLLLGACGFLSRPVFLSVDVALAALGLWNLIQDRGVDRQNLPHRSDPQERAINAERTRWFGRMFIAGSILVFVWCMLLGASLPPTDFDVREYHLQGPREYFEAGRIQCLEHNVYTSFPFLTEMLSLHAMVLRQDVVSGALSGKVVLMLFAPFTALAVGRLAAGLFGTPAGWLAALVHLSTPWTYRISIIAYAEGGLTFFTIATVLCLFLWRQTQPEGETSFCWRWSLLLGILSGSAMACKYPGLISVVLPAVILVCVTTGIPRVLSKSPRKLLPMAISFGVGLAVTIGPWLVKNLVETGNPVYPLAWSVLGGSDWDAELNTKWRAAHSSSDYRLTTLVGNLMDVGLRSDWLNCLTWAFAGVAVVAHRRLRSLRLLVAYTAWCFGSWWLLTHRIDRFWIPLLPILAVLAGGGVYWTNNRVWRRTCWAVVLVVVVVNLAFVTTGYCGNNAYLADLETLQRRTEKPGLRQLNRTLPKNALVLCVGEAEVFDARFPLIYNTVFDRSILQSWCTDSDGRQRDSRQIHDRLRAEGATHIYVNWREILRYRTTYGYTDFVTPQLFAGLVRAGVLESPVPSFTDSWTNLPDSYQAEIKRWGPGLVMESNGQRVVPADALYRVVEPL